MTDLPETVKRISTIEWLRERHDNCIRIAGSKVVGSEKRGWLEDAAYFKDAIGRLDELERVTGELRNREGSLSAAVDHAAEAFSRLEIARADLTAACARERTLISDRDEAQRGRMEWFEKAKVAERHHLTTSPAPPDHGDTEDALRAEVDASRDEFRKMIHEDLAERDHGDSALRRISAGGENPASVPVTREQVCDALAESDDLVEQVDAIMSLLASHATPAAARAEGMGEAEIAEIKKRHWAIQDAMSGNPPRLPSKNESILMQQDRGRLLALIRRRQGEVG